MEETRIIRVQQILRYPKPMNHEVRIDGHMNFFHVQQAPFEHRAVTLERGINGPSSVTDCLGAKRDPVIVLRSSSWNRGGPANPWTDEFDLERGHVRYSGDHKLEHSGPASLTRGNKRLLAASELHSSTLESQRLLAPPILIFRGTEGKRGGKRREKGFIEFCGLAILRSLTHVQQIDPKSGRTFPNLMADLRLLDLPDDQLDWRWIDDRRDPEVSANATLGHAPAAWRRWVALGTSASIASRRTPVIAAAKAAPVTPSKRSQEQLDRLRGLQRELRGLKPPAITWLVEVAISRTLDERGGRYRHGAPYGCPAPAVDVVGHLELGSARAHAQLPVAGFAIRSDSSAHAARRAVESLGSEWLAFVVCLPGAAPLFEAPVGSRCIVLHPEDFLFTLEEAAAESFGGSLAALLAAAQGAASGD